MAFDCVVIPDGRLTRASDRLPVIKNHSLMLHKTPVFVETKGKLICMQQPLDTISSQLGLLCVIASSRRTA